MKKSAFFPVICLAAASLVACSMQKGLKSSPVMLPEQRSEWTVSGVEYHNSDFSGLAFSADGSRMIAAFNSAGLYWLDIPGKDDSLHFTPFEVEGSLFRTERRDCECVTLDKATGDIWYGQERDSKHFKGASLYRIKAPAYDREELVYTFDNETVPHNNLGIEGLTWLGYADGGNFIAGCEGRRDKGLEPVMVFYSTVHGAWRHSISPKIKQIAELVYDDVRGCIWILDGDYDRILYRCTITGEILDRYPVPFIRNAEALLLDRRRGCIWIGSDETPSKLYRIPFRNL